MDHNAAFVSLAKQGAVVAEISFSGGHDSGEIDDIDVLDADYKNVSLDDETVLLGDAWEVLGNVYGSFALGFSVSGSIRYDVAEGRVVMTRSHEVWKEMDPVDCS
jgi:hypothetical protein